MFAEWMKAMQRKYQCIVEIERITREMGECLSRDDRMAVQMLLEMRQQEMNRGDQCKRDMERLLSVLPADEQQKLQMKEAVREKEEEIRTALKRAIDLDQYISRRLAGKDSYYESKL